MCRWFIYYGEPVNLNYILFNHNHSIIKQSYKKRYTPFLNVPNKRDHEVNVDGFGIGFYYDDSKNPVLYKSVKTPWNDFNIKNISKIIESKLIFSHVRAIKRFSKGLIHEFNCHPFNINNFMFMHNGDIKDFSKMKKKIIQKMDNHIFSLLKGNTDSEYTFGLILTFLKDSVIDNKNIKLAIIKTIKFLNSITDNVISFNIAITDGIHIIFTRYINNKERPPSLYYRIDKDKNICISSEPIDYEKDWKFVPKNSIGYIVENKINISKINL